MHRTVKNDSERTEQLKAIIMRTDIDDAKKLEMASALVEYEGEQGYMIV